jgi:mannose-1-phosphate guanylyltransferase
MNLSCRFGWHDWGNWKAIREGRIQYRNGVDYYYIQDTYCKNCSKRKIKKDTKSL